MTKWHLLLFGCFVFCFYFFFLVDQVSAVKFFGVCLFIALFSCRAIEARFTLRLLGLKFSGFWGAVGQGDTECVVKQNGKQQCSSRKNMFLQALALFRTHLGKHLPYLEKQLLKQRHMNNNVIG